MQPTWMCNQLQNTKKIEMCHDVYLIYREEHIYDIEYYIVIQPFFSILRLQEEKKYPILWSIFLIKDQFV